ncbi:hypothetical protein BCR26_01390 [Enterococcus rivorum]|uniref:Uncharacterized protein n=1 Tax=Enterococcus rivorum TaxID=762845 RepID=A0A1E5KYL5_9ENTE|nr:hypothetical protein BCR26_01390 [Enterococcus rivorum]
MLGRQEQAASKAIGELRAMLPVFIARLTPIRNEIGGLFRAASVLAASSFAPSTVHFLLFYNCSSISTIYF